MRKDVRFQLYIILSNRKSLKDLVRVSGFVAMVSHR